MSQLIINHTKILLLNKEKFSGYSEYCVEITAHISSTKTGWGDIEFQNVNSITVHLSDELETTKESFHEFFEMVETEILKVIMPYTRQIPKYKFMWYNLFENIPEKFDYKTDIVDDNYGIGYPLTYLVLVDLDK